jgi:predicted extracellular nuclease
VRWFPDGSPGGGRSPGAKPTDVEWLACAIAWLDVDVLALEELKNTPKASQALARLRVAIESLTGRRFRAEIDRCPGTGRQSLAFLYDAGRVTGSRFRNIDALNPHGSACEGNLRPGFAGYFRFAGGADLHLVAVHLKSGVGEREVRLRRTSTSRFADVFAEAQGVEADADIVFLGDFNTMGCDECRPKVRAAAEISALDAAFGSEQGRPVVRARSDLACSEYYRGEGNLLDHVVAARGMKEAPGARAQVSGYCADVACTRQRPRDMPRAYYELSDHCPVLFDIEDRDLD